jgi:hypothetical protein
MITNKNIKRRRRRNRNRNNIRGDILRDNVLKPYTMTIDLRTGYPDEMRVRMRLSWIETLNFGAGATGNQTIRANSLYDPEYDFGGEQPIGFTEWSALYQFYRVLQTNIRVTFMAANSTTGPCACAVWPSNSPTPVSPLDATTLLGLPRAKANMLGFGNGFAKLQLSMTHSTEEILGVYPLDQDYCGSATTNPLRSWYYQFACARVDGGTGGSVTCMIAVDYEAVFFGRNQIST